MILNEENGLFVFLIFISTIRKPTTNYLTIFQFTAICASIEVLIFKATNLNFTFGFVYIPFVGIEANFTSFAGSFNEGFACLTICSATTNISIQTKHLELLSMSFFALSTTLLSINHIAYLTLRLNIV